MCASSPPHDLCLDWLSAMRTTASERYLVQFAVRYSNQNAKATGTGFALA
jgi:hypothetical protein